MDHAIDALMPYYEVELETLAEEIESGRYRTMSACPSYPSARALLNAIHVLERHYYGKAKSLSIRAEMKCRKLI